MKEINKKIHQLKEEQLKLQSLLETKIIDTLRKQGAFSYDVETLISGISYVTQTLQRTDENAKAICASWKSMKHPPIEKSSPSKALQKAS